MPSAAPLPGPSPQNRATAREFMSVLFRRKAIILGLFAVTTATVVALALSTPVIYSSTGRVLVKRGERESALSPTRQVYDAWEEGLGSELEIVKSYAVLQRARQIIATEHPGGRIPIDGARVDAEVMGKSNVVGIAYTDLVPRTAQVVADAVVRAYVEYRETDPTVQYPKQFFDRELSQLEGQMNRLEDEKRAFITRTGAVDLEDQQREQIGNLGLDQQRLSDLDAQLSESRTQLRELQALQTHAGVDLPTLGFNPNETYTNEAALTELKRHIVDQQAHVAELKERYTDQSPEVQNAEATLASLKDLLAKEVKARFALTQSHIDALAARRGAIAQDIAAIHSGLRQMPSQARVLAAIDRELASLKLRYDDLVRRVNDAKTTEYTSKPATVILLSPAGAPVPRNTRDYVRLGLAPAFSLVIGIGLAFFLDGLDLTVRTAGQAEEALDLPVLAAVNERRRRRAG